MSGKKYILIILFSAPYLLWHLFTLPYYSLPSFDESYFASISLDFIEHGSLLPGHDLQGREALTGGPVYLFLALLSQKLFGTGISQFRIAGLLFGVLCIWISLKILKYKESGYTAILFAGAFAFDPFFNLGMHQGGMKLTALFFALLSLYFVLKDENKNIFYSAISASISLMTAPYSAIAISGLVMILLMNAYKDDKYKPLIQWTLMLLAIYALWLFYAFGGPFEYLHYYKSLRCNENLSAFNFSEGRFYIPPQEYVLITVAIFSIILNLIKRKIDFPDSLSSVSIAVILLFYVIMPDSGQYSVLIIPFYYIIIFNKGEFKWSLANPELYMLMALLTYNICYFTIKSAHSISRMEQRDPAIADKFITDYIPAGSKVVGDALYFFSTKKAGSDYQFLEKCDEIETKGQQHKEDFNYDYLIITDHSLKQEAEAVAIYIENSNFKQVARLKIASSALKGKISTPGLISGTQDDGYNATIYLRIKRHEPLPMAILKE